MPATAPMKHFIVIATDRPGTLALRTATRDAHRAYLKERNADGVTVALGGPTLGEDDLMDGTMLVLSAPDRAAAQRFVANDPYTRAQLFEALEIRAWNWTIGRPE